MKVDDATSVLSTFFPRPEKRIGGDVAQALMQNCMMGTIGYESNIGQTACDCTTVQHKDLKSILQVLVAHCFHK